MLVLACLYLLQFTTARLQCEPFLWGMCPYGLNNDDIVSCQYIFAALKLISPVLPACLLAVALPARTLIAAVTSF